MLSYLSFPNEIRSKHEALSHFPGQLEHGPDVTQSPSLNLTYSHINSNANTPKGSGLITHRRVWKEANVRTVRGLIAVGGDFIVRLLEPVMRAPAGFPLAASCAGGGW